MDAYQMMQGGEVIGIAQVQQEGLYYRIRCRCSLSGDTVCRVLVRWETGEESLGVLVPVDGAFGLDTRIPVKKLGAGTLSFVVQPKHRPLDGFFVPIYPEEPFSYISRLKDAFLERQKGQIGITIKEPGCA